LPDVAVNYELVTQFFFYNTIFAQHKRALWKSSGLGFQIFPTKTASDCGFFHYKDVKDNLNDLVLES